jgi:hypothetical protein
MIDFPKIDDFLVIYDKFSNPDDSRTSLLKKSPYL